MSSSPFLEYYKAQSLGRVKTAPLGVRSRRVGTVLKGAKEPMSVDTVLKDVKEPMSGGGATAPVVESIRASPEQPTSQKPSRKRKRHSNGSSSSSKKDPAWLLRKRYIK